MPGVHNGIKGDGKKPPRLIPGYMQSEMEEFEFEKIIRENLEPIEDIELVLLKGHLVIEQLITELLELSLEESNRLQSIRPMFNNKLEIYLAIEGNSIISEGLEKAIKGLNSLRNKLAHNLNHPGFDELLIQWAERAGRTKIENSHDKALVRKQLISAISQIAAFLSGVIGAKKHITSASTSAPSALDS